MSQVVGRLAPSPTGVLHVGNARSLLLAWLSARAQAGKILLRIEDLLQEDEDLTAALVRDLHWLGLDWDGRRMLQSRRTPLYAELLTRMQAAGLIYPCVCSRKDIETAALAPHAEDQGAAYPGTCRNRFTNESEALQSESERAKRAGRAPGGVVLRLRVDAVPERFVDVLCGPQVIDVAREAGDVVVRRKDGGFAYMFAVVVDDLATGVTEVVRGDDLLRATGQQLAVRRALVACKVATEQVQHGPSQVQQEADAIVRRARADSETTWIHVPLVLGDDGRRLAKRNKSTHLLDLRVRGEPAAKKRLLAWLAESLGLGATDDLAVMAQRFSWTAVPRSPVVFGRAELAAVVGRAGAE
jgi:glutamyl-tRNA synthetase